MLAKLMKYDLKWTYKLLVIFYSLALAFSLLTRLFLSIGDSTLCAVVVGIMRGCAISMMVSSIINALMRSWVRFIRGVYGDESYLTHTLPVPRSTVYLSKLLTSIICVFTSVLLTVACVFVCFYSEGMIEWMKSTFSIAAAAYDTSVTMLIVTLAAALFLQLVFILLAGYVGSIIGHRSSGARIARSVMWGFGIYIVAGGVMLATIFIIGLFNDEVMNVITTAAAVGIDAVKLLMITVIVVYAVCDSALAAVGYSLLKKGVNVD